MQIIAILIALVFCSNADARSTEEFRPDTIIALERGALERWSKGDPQGFFEIMAPDETYFDPGTVKRIDSLNALRQYLAPLAAKIKIEKLEMIDAKVQHSGDLAVLTFNLVDYGAQFNGGPKITAWNATEVYRQSNGKWKIVHSHWSFVKPLIKPPIAK